MTLDTEQQKPVKKEPLGHWWDRRKGDRRSQHQVLRRHLKIGGWVGNVLFVLIGVQFGWYLGGYGGAKFFEVLFLMDLTGPFAAYVGVIVGATVGILSVWAILVIVCAAFGALVYWITHRSFPNPV